MAEGFTKKKKYVLKGTAWYKCDECNYEWKVRHSKGGLKSCESPLCAKDEIQPYDFEPDPWTEGPTEWRLFGDFRCECGRTWPSAYTWIEWNHELNEWIKKKQICKDKKHKEECEVCPTHIRPLLHSGAQHSRKQHLTEYCEKCKELGPGKDCRNYTPQGNVDNLQEDEEGEDIPDDTSVISYCPSIDDMDGDDNRRTPVPSDEDTTESFFCSHLKKLN